MSSQADSARGCGCTGLARGRDILLLDEPPTFFWIFPYQVEILDLLTRAETAYYYHYGSP